MLIIRTPEGYKQVVAPEIDIYEYAAANGGTVMDDSEYFEPAKTEAELKIDIADKTTSLRAVADYAIRPLQYALDVDDASPAELALLKAWKEYVVALSRIPDQPGYPSTVEWPVTPV
jgi:hypothetical protein